MGLLDTLADRSERLVVEPDLGVPGVAGDDLEGADTDHADLLAGLDTPVEQLLPGSVDDAEPDRQLDGLDTDLGGPGQG